MIKGYSISVIENLKVPDCCFRRISVLDQKTVAIQRKLGYVVLAKINLSRTEDRREDAKWQVSENGETAIC